MTVEDPWGAAPQEAQAAPATQPEPPQDDPWGAPPPAAAPAPTPEPAPAPVAAAPAPVAQAPSQPALAAPQVPASDGQIVLTFKEGTGFDSSWVVVHANSVDEAAAILDRKFQALLDKSKQVAAYFRGGPVAAAASGGQRALQPGQPAGSVEAPSWAPPKPFADFVYVTKVSAKTGRPWHAWMAPEKGDTREALFFNPPR